MLKKLKGVFLFDTEEVKDLETIRVRIMKDNRRFAVIWSLVQFLYGAFCFFLSFGKELFIQCRSVYVSVMILSSVAFLFAVFFARKELRLVYCSIFINYASILSSGILIARILLKDGNSTIMVFASLLIVPILFLSNTFLNILLAVTDIVAAAVLLKGALTTEIYRWCLTDIVIFASMGVIIGHFVNKARYERYVFAESAVQLADSNAKIAELQRKYAYYDQMTGLQNRRAYSEKVKELSDPMPAGYVVVMIDCNGLKRVNDTFGHVAGDECITGVADCLVRTFSGVETVYRLGGDEFCVVLKSTCEAVRIKLEEFERLCAEWKGQYADKISASYGIASTDEFSDFETVLRTSDRRMYEFKNNYHKNND